MRQVGVDPVNLDNKFDAVHDAWQPHIVAEVNDVHVKVVKLRGEFLWHHHDTEDELFLVHKGILRIRLRDGEIVLKAGELAVIPHGVEHLPIADEEVEAVLIEPATTLNTGNVQNERTVSTLKRL